jgi:DNA-binding GntR family transcriptional regulator
MGAFVEHALEDRRPHNLREKAYDSFTRRLLAREIRAGQFISQRELVEITGLPQRGITPKRIAEAQDTDWDLHASIVDSLGNAIISDAYRVNSIKIRLIRQQQTRLNDGVVIPTMARASCRHRCDRNARSGSGVRSFAASHLERARPGDRLAVDRRTRVMLARGEP